MKTSWSRTYIVYKGRKVYLDDTLWELKEKMSKSKNGEVKLNVSGILFDREKVFSVNDITYSGKI